MCTLDASKAFDRVNLLLFFSKLLPLSTVPTFHNVYLFNQQMRVKWNSTTSNTFSTSNSVKQGGFLSPILFNV